MTRGPIVAQADVVNNTASAQGLAYGGIVMQSLGTFTYPSANHFYDPAR